LLLKKLEEFFADDTIEGESPLADENYNAVRLLTIHKAKGLELSGGLSAVASLRTAPRTRLKIAFTIGAAKNSGLRPPASAT